MGRKAVNRRTVLKGTGACVGLAALAGSGGTEQARGMAGTSIHFKNASFYDSKGAFKVDAAKDAYIAMMKYHGYPIYPKMKEELWASDYGTGQFTKLGLAARMWVNNEKDRYMLMDLFILPGQMLPEHWHLKGETNPAKLEGWLVRYGMSHIVGEGEPNLPKEIVIPKCHMKGKATTMHDTPAGPGEFVPLNRVGARHWQYAGPEGAILSEVANVHTGDAVRHSDQAINDNFLAG